MQLKVEKWRKSVHSPFRLLYDGKINLIKIKLFLIKTLTIIIIFASYILSGFHRALLTHFITYHMADFWNCNWIKMLPDLMIPKKWSDEIFYHKPVRLRRLLMTIFCVNRRIIFWYVWLYIKISEGKKKKFFKENFIDSKWHNLSDFDTFGLNHETKHRDRIYWNLFTLNIYFLEYVCSVTHERLQSKTNRR